MGLDKKARKSISEVEEKVHKRLAALNLDKKIRMEVDMSDYNVKIGNKD